MIRDDKFYEEFVNRLLYLDSVQNIRQALQNTPGVDNQRLLKMFEIFENSYVQKGHEIEQNLLCFVRDIVKDFFRQQGLTTPTNQNISTTKELIGEGLKASNALQTYRLLQKHHHLINPQFFHDLEKMITAYHRDSPQFLRWLKLYCIVSFMVDEMALTAKGYMFWASYCTGIGRYDVAERRLHRAIKIARESDDRSLTIMAKAAMASLYDRMQMKDEAIDEYEEALKTAEESNELVMVSGICRNLAACYRSAGHYLAALTLTDRCLASPKSFYIPEDEARDRLKRGLILEDLGDYTEGEVEYEIGAHLAENIGNWELWFQAMNNVAASLLKQNNTREALRSFREILQIVEKWGNPVVVGSTHNNIGNTLLQAKRPADALKEFGKALALFVNSGKHYSEAISYLGIGDAHRDLGNYETANTFYTLMLVPYYESGDFSILTMYASRLLYEYNNLEDEMAGTLIETREMARKSGRIMDELMLTNILAKYYLHKGDNQHAEAIYRESIDLGNTKDPAAPLLIRLKVGLAKMLGKQGGQYQEAYDLLSNSLQIVNQKLRKELIDRQRGEIVSEWVNLYGSLIDLLLSRGKELSLSNAVAAEDLAFDLHESTKSRTFIASLANAPITQPVSIPKHLRQRETDLLTLKRSLQDREERSEIKSRRHRRDQLQEIYYELQQCWKQMKPYAPDYVKLRMGEPATLKELKMLSSQQTNSKFAFVSFFCDVDTTTIFVLRSDEAQLRTFRINISRDTLSKIVIHLRSTFNGSSEVFPPTPPISRHRPWDRQIKFFEDLSDELLTFLPAVKGVDHLCILPHGPLHLLPLHALKLSDGKFLIEHFAITYCPSISTLSYCLFNQQPNIEKEKQRSIYVAGVASREDVYPEFFEEDHKIFDKKVYNIHTDQGKHTANKGRILNQLDKYDVIHLTCHGYFNSTDPMNSGLLFSNGEERPPRNPLSISIMERNRYLITVRDFLQTRMQSHIVTLRACSTGIQGQQNLGDEFSGFSRALLYAGNSTVLASLWNVDQQSSLQLLTRFYHYWLNPEKPIEKWRALWMAQNDFLTVSDEPFLHHPYHWAPFVLIGNWR